MGILSYLILSVLVLAPSCRHDLQNARSISRYVTLDNALA